MSLTEIMCIIKANGSGIIIAAIIIMTIIQIAPIKIDPWTKLVSWIGRALNSETNKKIEDISKDLDDLKKDVKKLELKVNEEAVIECRTRIIKFGDEISHGFSHSRDNFQMIMHDITVYDQYCANHPEFKNNMTKITSERIEEDYKERDRTGDFL